MNGDGGVDTAMGRACVIPRRDEYDSSRRSASRRSGRVLPVCGDDQHLRRLARPRPLAAGLPKPPRQDVFCKIRGRHHSGSDIGQDEKPIAQMSGCDPDRGGSVHFDHALGDRWRPRLLPAAEHRATGVRARPVSGVYIQTLLSVCMSASCDIVTCKRFGSVP
jgi:hypothetical protein